MLSRVAERIYWLGRYLERVESTSRLISVYSNVLLDLPQPAKLVWQSLLAINGDEQNFAQRFSNTPKLNIRRNIPEGATVVHCKVFRDNMV
ncbi:MAG: alpha-E domain-containing protein, partial [Pseudomonadota bacterium]